MYPLFIIGVFPELDPRDRQVWMGGEGGREGKLLPSFCNKSCISQQQEKNADFPICQPLSSSLQPLPKEQTRGLAVTLGLRASLLLPRI